MSDAMLCLVIFGVVTGIVLVLAFIMFVINAVYEFWKIIENDVYENLADKFRGKGVTSKKIQRLMERGKLRLVAERHNNKLSIYLQDKKTDDLIYLDYLNIKELMKDE